MPAQTFTMSLYLFDSVLTLEMVQISSENELAAPHLNINSKQTGKVS
jgi:hypothetical protein